MEPIPIHEELERLCRILREEIFRFVLVEYNHIDAIKQAEQFIRTAYPRRSILELKVGGRKFRYFSDQIHAFKKGIVFIPDFDELFRDENSDFRIAFNQRRDWLALQPLALVCFVPAGGLPKVMEGMPDFWSRRDAELEMFVPHQERSGLIRQDSRPSTLGGTNAEEKNAELQRLRSEIAAADPDNFSQLDNLYRQLLPLLQDVGDYRAGLEAARQYYHLANLQDDKYGAVDALSFAHERQALFHRHLGQLSDAVYHCRKYLELAERAGDEEEIDTAQNNLALVLQDLGDYAGAKELLERALASAEKNFGPDHPTTAVRYSNLALVLKDLGDYAWAKELLEKAVASDEKNFEPNHPKMAVRYSNLALILQNLGDYAGAKELLEKAVASAEKNFGPDHPTTVTSYSNLALVLQALGDYTGAKELLEKAMASTEKNFGPDHPTTAVSYSNLAVVLKDLGDYSGAKGLLENAVTSAEKNFGPDHPTTAVRYNNLAHVHLDLKEWQQAAELFQKAYVVFEKTLGRNHPNTETVKQSLAHAQAQLAKTTLSPTQLRKKFTKPSLKK